jgi:IS5 family transposase
MLRRGTIVDSTLIESPSSTKNKAKSRDSEAHQTKKGNVWHFGYKAHIHAYNAARHCSKFSVNDETAVAQRFLEPEGVTRL